MVPLRLFFILFLVHLGPILVLCQYTAYDYGFDVSTRVKRQLAQRRLVVRGATGGGEIHVRQEIRALEQDQDLWTLYILGLSMMQYSDQSSPTSWYGITGLCYQFPFPCFVCRAHSLTAYPRHTRSTLPTLGRRRPGAR